MKIRAVLATAFVSHVYKSCLQKISRATNYAFVRADQLSRTVTTRVSSTCSNEYTCSGQTGPIRIWRG